MNYFIDFDHTLYNTPLLTKDMLNALASYIPEDEEEAMLIVEKTIPRLQHVNSAVMLG